MQVLTGKEYFGWFVEHINATNNQLGQDLTPAEIWDTAVKTWKEPTS